jgi:hypothetical protein
MMGTVWFIIATNIMLDTVHFLSTYTQFPESSANCETFCISSSHQTVYNLQYNISITVIIITIIIIIIINLLNTK